jgi:transposase-like protein
MNTDKLTFQQVLRWTDNQCREYLESKRWPTGAHCPKCNTNSPYILQRKTETKNKVQRLYKCRACGKQFTATIGTIFEDSHIPLNKWFAAIFLMCASKKGISAHQLHRTLDITYKSAWFMAHRIREAMRDKGVLMPLSGTVEADETYIGGKPRGHPIWKERIQDEIQMGLRPRPGHPRMEKAVVFGILERNGKARTITVPEVNRKTMMPILKNNLDLDRTRLITDGNKAYKRIQFHVNKHDVIDHEKTYVSGDIHIQGIENYWSLLKRGLYGIFHHVNRKYLPQYLDEFQYRYNHRDVTDAERFAALFAQVQGRLDWYCQKPQSESHYA